MHEITHQFLLAMPGNIPWVMVSLFVLIPILFIGLIIGILFLLNLQNTLKAVSVQNRKMEPGMVWLALIPIFNLVWNFIVVDRISKSIQAEYAMREQPVEAKPTYAIGMAWCILTLCGFIPVLGSFAGLASLVCFIIYWVKTSEFKRAIQQLPSGVPAEDHTNSMNASDIE